MENIFCSNLLSFVSVKALFINAAVPTNDSGASFAVDFTAGYIFVYVTRNPTLGVS